MASDSDGSTARPPLTLPCRLPKTEGFVKLTPEWVELNIDPRLQRYLTQPQPKGYGLLYCYIRKTGLKKGYGGQTRMRFKRRHRGHLDNYRRSKRRSIRVALFDTVLHHVGEKGFYKFILAVLPLSELDQGEVDLIAQFRLFTRYREYGYNMTSGGKAPQLSAESCAKISETKRNFSPAKKLLISKKIKQAKARRLAIDPDCFSRSAREQAARKEAADPGYLSRRMKAIHERKEAADPGYLSRIMKARAARMEKEDPGCHSRNIKKGKANMSDERRAQAAENNRAALRRPEARAKASANSKAVFQRPEVIVKHKKSLKAAWDKYTPEERAERVAGMNHHNPEVRAKALETRKVTMEQKRKEDPECTVRPAMEREARRRKLVLQVARATYKPFTSDVQTRVDLREAADAKGEKCYMRGDYDDPIIYSVDTKGGIGKSNPIGHIWDDTYDFSAQRAKITAQTNKARAKRKADAEAGLPKPVKIKRTKAEQLAHKAAVRRAWETTKDGKPRTARVQSIDPRNVAKREARARAKALAASTEGEESDGVRLAPDTDSEASFC